MAQSGKGEYISESSQFCAVFQTTVWVADDVIQHDKYSVRQKLTIMMKNEDVQENMIWEETQNSLSLGDRGWHFSV